MEVSIVFLQNGGSPREVPISPGTHVLGREKSCQIRIPIAEVSRKHCELTLTEAGLAVRDLGSANGTIVNGKRVDEEALGAGDAVVIGPCQFVVRIDGLPADSDLAEIASAALATSANEDSPDIASSVLDELGPLSDDDSSLIDFDFDLDDSDDQPAL